jgi:cytoskeleton protein RodZ
MRDSTADHDRQNPAANDYAREKPDGTLDPLGEAGWYLQHERETRGETLDQAGEMTGIHPYHIEAIEYGDMTRMPERVEALEMIGTYAQYLGFDPEPLVQHYAQFLPRPVIAPKANHPANPAPLSSAKILKFGKLPQMPKFAFKLNGIPGGAGGLVASLAGAVMLFAGVSYMMMPDAADLAPSGQMAETRELPQIEPPTAPAQGETAEIKITDEPMTDDERVAAAAEYTADDLAGTGLDGLDDLISKSIPASKEQTASIGAVPSADDVAMTGDGREFGIKNEDSRLTLKAKAPVWIRIEDARGNVVLTQMLNKGDTYKVPNREGLVVIARDGGLLAYLIDGKEKGILGTPGEILVGRPLDLKTLGGNG